LGGDIARAVAEYFEDDCVRVYDVAGVRRPNLARSHRKAKDAGAPATFALTASCIHPRKPRPTCALSAAGVMTERKKSGRPFREACAGSLRWPRPSNADDFGSLEVSRSCG